MGLDFNAAVEIPYVRWPYSGFNRFREELANLIGIRLRKMKGFGGDISWNEYCDNLIILLDHSDCDGLLTPVECALCYPRLEEVLDEGDFDDYDLQMGRNLAEAMRRCAEAEVDLIFC